MVFTKRKRSYSDASYIPSDDHEPKRTRIEVTPDPDDVFAATSSAPASPILNPIRLASPDEREEEITMHPTTPTHSYHPSPMPGPSTYTTPIQSPSKNTVTAGGGGPASSPMSVLERTPLTQKMGRPKKSPRRGKNTAFNQGRQELTNERRTMTARVKSMQREVNQAAKLAKKKEEIMSRRDKALKIIDLITKPNDEGGFGFKNLNDFVDSLLELGGNSQTRANLSRLCESRGKEMVDEIINRSGGSAAAIKHAILSEEMQRVLAEEGRKIQKLFTRSESTKLTELLQSFSVEGIKSKLKEEAPNLWDLLTKVSNNPRRTRGGRRDKELVSISQYRLSYSFNNRLAHQVFVTICAMISILRSQRANNFQAVVGLFLIGSGASKREMEVLAHAGISLSYNGVIIHLKSLSSEAKQRYRTLIKTCMCSIVWDNLNIAFRVEAQRLNSKNHFDSGTTATLIPIYNPFTKETRTPYGELPLSMKPKRDTTDPVLQSWSDEQVLPTLKNLKDLTACSLWQLKRISREVIPELAHLSELEECPQVDPIDLHQTEQYPLPAMHIDESSIEGTIQVYKKIFQELGMTSEDIERHGLMFLDGDQLTDSLINKVESSRRNSEDALEGLLGALRRFGIFHAKMSGNRMVMNEHWGKPNSKYPGGLWWENNKLNRKNISAGWQSKKAAEWKPSHELATISIAAHVKDGFRIHCGKDSLEDWAQTVTDAEFNRVAETVYQKLFTTKAYDDLKSKSDRDTTVENAVLYNRDVLFYIEIVHAIKAGDIGRVVNVLKMWMIMMRTKNTMPRYADVIFETLGRLETFDPKLKKFFLHNWLVNLTGRANGFKEIDLLQEHQNFWAKIIYNAKGANRSWEWLAMITVCIFELRKVIQLVQREFKIPYLGTHHTVPSMTKEIEILTEALKDNEIQTYVLGRPSNEFVKPVRDLLEEGSKYPNTRGAFKNVRNDTRAPINLGYTEGLVGDAELDQGTTSDGEVEGDELATDDYEVTYDDLSLDQEEPYGAVDDILEFLGGMDS
ncbi:hypothetical protein AAF712_016482 [Marasmius tenuissimus]|uniref:DUF6589 domain-containing protein n=1 Tax=Marasmius tenuissimus TaxID=585030 RepID=A0ABR2Z6K4_9AGAR